MNNYRSKDLMESDEEILISSMSKLEINAALRIYHDYIGESVIQMLPRLEELGLITREKNGFAKPTDRLIDIADSLRMKA
jgi:hypothetical protein